MGRGLPLGLACVAVVLACACSTREIEAPPPASPEEQLALPDALRLDDGRRVTSLQEWPERRAQILELFTAQVYGRAPGRPEQLDFRVLEEDPQAMGGRAVMRRVAITSHQAGRVLTFELLRFAPAGGARSAAFLLLNHRPPSNTDASRARQSEFWPAEEIVARGYTAVAIQTSELAPDDPATYRNGAIRLFEGDAVDARRPDAWKTIAAWSWGASRALDYLETDPLVDATRVAVIGHSRGGKAALWAGAQDERFSLTISNESGCAGAAISRRPVGETVAGVNLIFPHWFADNFRQYDGKEETLPVDQHMLLGLLAPRAVVVGSAADDEWSDPQGEFLGLAYASSVYALWGLAPIDEASMPAPGGAIFVAPRGYHIRPGGHDLTALDWRRYLDVGDQIWPR
jgi:hypothetical protein